MKFFDWLKKLFGNIPDEQDYKGISISTPVSPKTHIIPLGPISGFSVKNIGNGKKITLSGFNTNPRYLEHLVKGDHLIIVTENKHHGRYIVEEFTPISKNGFFFITCGFYRRGQDEWNMDQASLILQEFI